MPHSRWVLIGLVATLALAVACGDNDDAPPVGSSTARVTGVASTASVSGVAATPTAVTPTPVPTIAPPSAAETLAKDPSYLVYVVGRGDTLARVAAAFNGQPGTAKAGFPNQIKDLNRLANDLLATGQELAVPLLLGDTRSLLPEAGLELALGMGKAGGKLVLLQPSQALRDAYNGRLVAHRVVLEDGEPAGEGYGYTIQYWLTDRPSTKGGVPDPDARVTDLAFTVSGGSLASSASGIQVFGATRDGVKYTVAAGAMAGLSAERIAGLLVTSAER